MCIISCAMYLNCYSDSALIRKSRMSPISIQMQSIMQVSVNLACTLLQGQLMHYTSTADIIYI